MRTAFYAEARPTLRRDNDGQKRRLSKRDIEEARCGRRTSDEGPEGVDRGHECTIDDVVANESNC